MTYEYISALEYPQRIVLSDDYTMKPIVLLKTKTAIGFNFVKSNIILLLKEN